MTKPTPIDKEIELDPKRYLVSRTDEKGVIEYVNDYFIEVSGYLESELIGQPHNLIRHPDMPRIVFKLMWEHIQSGKNILALVKNLAKDGRYYWVYTSFEPNINRDDNKIIGYIASRKAAPRDIIDIIAPLYDKLLEIEKSEGMEASEKYLNSFLKEKGENITFENIMDEIYKFY